MPILAPPAFAAPPGHPVTRATEHRSLYPDPAPANATSRRTRSH